ncbi:calponin homology domain-containing protein [Roseicella aerolata]|uniref:Uncharacterized protein n=1 Tax=Roseicella aerolata TaxID=2883479 RepID=A0A9X1LC02_9PROT|nr:hypothetical protein [Roseicella aerolata]MCB4823613.1 hypothetical protein [Roseicella aerolata]
MAGNAYTIAGQVAEEIRRSQPCHCSLLFQAGESFDMPALRSVDRFVQVRRPLLEPIGVPVAGAA